MEGATGKPHEGQETAKKDSFFRTRVFGVILVWTIIISAAVGTHYLTREIEHRVDNTAAVFSGAIGAVEIGLYRDRAEPASVAVYAGEEVKFVVRDESRHNIAQEGSRRGDARLVSGSFGRGESYSLVFSTRGEYYFYDRTNLDIRVTVLVK